MANIDFLNSKQKKKLLETIKTQFGIKDLNFDCIFFRNKDKVFLLSRAFSKLAIENLRINSLGLYFCRMQDNGVRLSIEGSQIIGNKARKNILEIDKIDLYKWIRGQNLETEKSLDGFVIIKHKNDFLGCGKSKNGIILNYIPRNRRIKVL